MSKERNFQAGGGIRTSLVVLCDLFFAASLVYSAAGPSEPGSAPQRVERPADDRGARADWYLRSRLDPETGMLNVQGLEAAWQHKESMPSATDGATTAIQQSIAGDSWFNLGPKSFNTTAGPWSGRIATIAPIGANTIYIGSALGGVWKTTNRGGHWEPLSDFEKSLAIGSIGVDPDNSSILYAGTGEYVDDGSNTGYGAGILKSTDGGQTWKLKGEAQFHRASISQVLVDPRSIADPEKKRIVYVASNAGFFKSSDSGESWSQLMGGSYSDAVFDPSNPGIIYVARWGSGIYKYVEGSPPPTSPLTDLNGELPTSRFGRISLAATMDTVSNSPVLLASMQDHVAGNMLKGVWKSTTGGSRWVRLAGAPPSFGDGVFPFPDSWEAESNDSIYTPNPVAVGTFVEGTISTAADEDFFTFTTIGDHSFTIEVLADRASSGLSPLLELFDGNRKLLRSTQGGLPYPTPQPNPSMDGRITSYQIPAGTYYLRVSSGDGSTGRYQVSITGLELGCQCAYDQVLAVEPNNPNVLYMGTVGMFRSDDGGTNWTEIHAHGGTNQVHTDIHSIEFFPGGGTTFLVGTDGGIWESSDRGNTWINRNGDLSITQSYPGMSMHPTDPDFLVFGTQDNGSIRYQNGVWTRVSGSDGGYSAVKDQNTWYVTEIKLHVRKTTDNFATPLVSKNSGLDWEAAEFIAPLVMSPTASNVLIAGGGKGTGQTPAVAVYRTDDSAGSWSANSQNLPGGGIVTLAFAPSNTNVYYAGNRAGRVYRTTDAGASDWTEVTGAGLPARAIEALEVSPTDWNVVYAGVGGFSGGNLFRTTNAGAASVQWVDIGHLASNPSDQLPDCPVNAVAVDPNYPDTLFVGTDVGLFRTVDGGLHWTTFDAGLPHTAVFDIVISTTAGPKGKMRAATHGRGIWELETSNDACDKATAITDGSFTGSTRGTSAEGSTGCDPSTDSPDVWYSYTATCDGELHVDTCGSNFDTVVSLHDPGCPGTSLTETVCNDDCGAGGCGLRDSCTDKTVSQGETVLIRVSGYGGATGEFKLNVSCGVPNDICEDSRQLAVGGTAQSGTRGAGLDYAPTCSGIDDTAPGVWYSVIGTGNTMTASLCNSPTGTYDSKLSVYCAGCATKQCVAANDDSSCGTSAEVSWCAAPGNVYNILVHGYQSQSGPFRLDISDDGISCGPFYQNCNPGNDSCAAAESLTNGRITASNTDAGTDGTASCASTVQDVWYEYATACHGFATFDTCLGNGSLEDTVLSVYDGCLGRELGCNDDAPSGCAFRRSRLTVTHRPGMTLKVRGAAYGGAPSTSGTFDLGAEETLAQLAAPRPGLYAVDGRNLLENHLLRVDTEEDTLTDVGDTGVAGLAGLAYASGLGLLYGIDDRIDLDQLVTIDPTTGVASPFSDSVYTMVRSLAYDSDNLVLYGTDTFSDVLLRIDPYSGFETEVGPLGFGDVEGLAYDPFAKVLYGSDVDTDQLLTIDTATGTATAVGTFGGTFTQVEGLAFDTVQGILFGVDRNVTTGEGVILRIDTTTGAATADGPTYTDLDPEGLAFLEGLPAATSGRVYDAVIPVSGGCPAYLFSNIAGLPPGLVADGEGRITGTPTAPGSYTVTFDFGDHDLATPAVSGASMPLIVRPENNDCFSSLVVSDGATVFDSSYATTDGPDEPAVCDYFGYSQVDSDLWFCYTATCTGTLTAATCSSGYDTKLAVYDGCGCDAEPPADACNDDFCGALASVDTPVTAGREYMIRVGGYQGATGSGQLDLTCTGDPAGACCTDAGCVITTASDCGVQNGAFQGQGSTCTPDTDNDGVIDACDSCPSDSAKTDPGQCGCGVSEIDLDADGIADCNDDDDDGDGYTDIVDCDDQDYETFPMASETNDGRDNQCPGDPGFGLVDELDCCLVFSNPSSKAEFSWPGQAGATGYDVARSDGPGFTACTMNQTANSSWTDSAVPLPGNGYYYMVRGGSPYTGSWGADSQGAERQSVCP